MHPAPSSSSSLVRTWDKSYIRSIWSAPEIYPFIVDDYSPSSEKMDVIVNEHVIYLRPFEGGALFMLHPLSQNLWVVHGGVLLSHRSKSTEYARDCVCWMRNNTRCRCIMALVPELNLNAMSILEKVGFRMTGDVARSILLHGSMTDQKLYVMEC